MSEKKKASILLVDDEEANIESLERIFQREDFHVFSALNGRKALEVLQENSIDVVLCDVMMPHMDGIELLKDIRNLSPYIEVIMMTAYGNIERAVESMKMGAYDFLTKPLKRRELVKTVEKALEKNALLRENEQLRKTLDSIQDTSIIGNSQAIRRVLEISKQAAQSTATILLHGESGTGKELFAKEIHRNSPRSQNRFVPVNCAAIPETLLDSELFGFEKGSFTGAHQSKQGKFEMAHQGTLFLDEIGELPQTAQIRLLRVLQEKNIDRLGSMESIPVDFRLVAATHKDLRKEVEAGHFREDLFYRLNVIEITIPPLRERVEDIALLAHHFLQLFAAKNNKGPMLLAPETLELLQNYRWPGNVRQLENVMQRAVVLSHNSTLLPSDLPPEISHTKAQGNYFIIPFGTSLEEIERHVIDETLRRTEGDKKLTAQLLGIATRTIYRKMEAAQEEES